MRVMKALGGMAVAMLLVSCSSAPPAAQQPTEMRAVDVGTAVDGDNRISNATREFDPQDVVYVTIATDGTMPATLTVQWYANTKLFATDTLPIHPTGSMSFAFHQLPESGWPHGKSRAIFFLAPENKHVVEFQVR
jgi:hypothetical protein